jgi:hypothetical protein
MAPDALGADEEQVVEAVLVASAEVGDVGEDCSARE